MSAMILVDADVDAGGLDSDEVVEYPPLSPSSFPGRNAGGEKNSKP
jgi:hypothetical protein